MLRHAKLIYTYVVYIYIYTTFEVTREKKYILTCGQSSMCQNVPDWTPFQAHKQSSDQMI